MKVESTLGIVAVFGALAVLLGYVFELGYVLGFDQRLLQFLTVEDYVSTSAIYVFTVPAGILAATVVVEDSLRLPINVRDITRALFLEAGEFNPLTIRRCAKVANWIIGICLGIFVPTALVDFKIISWLVFPSWLTLLSAAVLRVCGLGIAFSAVVRYLPTIRKPEERRLVGGIAIVYMTFIAMWVYGGYEGMVILAKSNNDVSVVLKNGTEIDGVLLGKFANGIAYKHIGDSSIHFIPDDEMVDVTLIKTD